MAQKNDFKLPANYVEVKYRIPKFFEKYPEGKIIPEPPVFERTGNGELAGVWVHVKVYANHDDFIAGKVLGAASAWENYPGATSFTSNSEVMNAETAAVGRALVFSGAVSADKGIASGDEIAVRAMEQQEILAIWQKRIDELSSVSDLKTLYTEAALAKAGNKVLEAINLAANKLKAEGA